MLPKFLLLEALLFVVLGPALLYAEMHFLGSAATQQVVSIIALSSGYFAYSLASLAIFGQVVKGQKSNSILMFYFGSKALRLFLSIVAFTAYAMLCGANLLAFAINLLVFYFTSVIVATIYCAKMEKKYKQQVSTK